MFAFAVDTRELLTAGDGLWLAATTRLGRAFLPSELLEELTLLAPSYQRAVVLAQPVPDRLPHDS